MGDQLSKATFLVGSNEFRANKNVSDSVSNERLSRLCVWFSEKIAVVVTASELVIRKKIFVCLKSNKLLNRTFVSD
jgi:hypothetical protein